MLAGGTNQILIIPLGSGGGGGGSPLTTQGDIFVYTTMDDRLPIGAAHTVLGSNGTLPHWEDTLDLAQAGTGALIAGDISGNARGSSATDIQTYRDDALQVASGYRSFAAGTRNRATSSYSTALGAGNTASGGGSLALGSANTAIGTSSFGIGSNNNLPYSQGLAVGSGNQQHSSGGVLLGFNNNTYGYGVAAIGQQSAATGYYSVAVGSAAVAYATSTLAIGYSVTAYAPNSVAIGLQLTNNTTYSVEVGVSDSAKARIYGGGLSLTTAGQGFKIKEGTNATMGTATLNGATGVTVSTTKVTATSRIFLSIQSPGGTPAGVAYVSSRSAGVSFVIKGVALDTSVVAWMIINPSP